MKELLLVVYSAAYALLNVLGATFVKSGLASGDTQLNKLMDFVHLFLRIKILGGLAIIFASALVLFKALTLFEFSKVIPLSVGINFVFTAIIGVFVFSEDFNWMKALAMVIILVGVFLLVKV